MSRDPAQMDFFMRPLFPSRTPSTRLDMDRYRAKMKRAMARAIRECPYDRPTIAARMVDDAINQLRHFMDIYQCGIALVGNDEVYSRDRYLYEAYTVWPQSKDKTLGLWDARVNGFDVHGRRGDTDLVIIGPAGRLPTELERTIVRNAVTAAHIKPDAVSVSVLTAQRVEYTASLVVEVPGIGPSPEVIKAEAEARVTAAALTRTLIGGEIPAGFLASAAYGDNVIKVRDLAPVVIEPDPYKVPVMTEVTVTVEVR